MHSYMSIFILDTFVSAGAHIWTRTETSKPPWVLSSKGVVGYAPAYVICGTTSVIAADSILTTETLFQMPFEKVGMPSCAVLVYGAQSHPPVHDIHRPAQSIFGSKITESSCELPAATSRANV